MLRIFRKFFLKTTPDKYAMVYAVPGFVMIVAASGNRRWLNDPEAFQCTLPVDSPAGLLANAIQEALTASRLIPLAQLQTFLDSSSDLGYKACVDDLWRLVGAKPRPTVPPNTAYCSVYTQDDSIVFHPTRKRRGSVWENLSQGETIKIQSLAEPRLIGQSLIEALSRCTPQIVPPPDDPPKSPIRGTA